MICGVKASGHALPESELDKPITHGSPMGSAMRQGLTFKQSVCKFGRSFERWRTLVIVRGITMLHFKDARVRKESSLSVTSSQSVRI